VNVGNGFARAREGSGHEQSAMALHRVFFCANEGNPVFLKPKEHALNTSCKRIGFCQPAVLNLAFDVARRVWTSCAKLKTQKRVG